MANDCVLAVTSPSLTVM